MKKIFRELTMITILTAATLAGAQDAAAPAAASGLSSDLQKSSYTLGFQVSSQFKKGGLEIDNETFMKGFADGIGEKTPQISPDEQMAIVEKIRAESQSKMQAKLAAAKQANTEAAKKFLEENKAKEGVKSTASGLQYKVLTSGDAAGKSPVKADVVKVNYKGRLINGTVFDASENHGGPAQFGVGGVIKGWTEALQLMKPGDKWELYVPPELAYGENSPSPDIEPNSLLIFEVELVSIEAPKAPPAAAPATK